MRVRDRVDKHKADFTPAERRIVPFLKDDARAIELQSITKLADAANVSTPTVIRLARKLGFDGFADLQTAIRAELAERIKQPLAKLEAELPDDQSGHIVTRFAEKAVQNINQTIGQLDFAAFDAAAKLLGDPDRALHLIGGRITGPLAQYLAHHLQIIRPRVQLVSSSQNLWPQTVLDMDRNAVLIIFDIRRYEKQMAHLAALAAERGARIVLFTDQWGSPIERIADHCFRAMVEAPSSWDSTMALNFLVESLIAEIQKRNADDSARRIREMEKMIGATGLFGRS
ncbi:MurR/RpiR family transcriptional regulator [Actibacterium ureilyticum]|uniref:MurR/RpiR family transcriptional regulator n=1 Tax=Actibacterium ureilyticum TaxID=1590614 RepID=UPI000BAAF435|nr:MurR/RpiR family transcriptional regulator [Actibacterium ureilyticum]